jgi:ATP-binding cassette subfamily C (CFTR/MRP) protein 1
MSQATWLASEWWLASWSRATADSQGEAYWLWVYALLTGVIIVICLARSLLFFDFMLRAATRIHDVMAHHVLRAPLAFFHTNPAGRILNRCVGHWQQLMHAPVCH